MTLIGIMADSHDNQIGLVNAIELFNEIKVDYIFHAGDFIAPFSVKKIISSGIPSRFVFGNNDGEKELIIKLINDQTNSLIENVLLIEKIEDTSIAMTHGHVNNVLTALLQSGQYDLVISGHTHKKVLSKMKNGTIHINPGETFGWLYNSSTIVTFDLESKKVDFFDIEYK